MSINIINSFTNKKKHIDQKEWQDLIAQDDKAVILDVRTPRECANGIIEDAKMIDIFDTTNFLNSLQKLDKNKNYYVYCRSGNRSGQACQIMENMGFETTFNLTDGLLAWQGTTIIPT